MSPSNMLELQKLVLENVYENTMLFEKELRKSFKLLDRDDLNKLYYWAIDKFNRRYNLINCVYMVFDFRVPSLMNSNG
jgi:hypothetical protein